MKKAAAAALNARLASKHETQTRISSAETTTMKTIYTQFVDYLLRTYATKEKIADKEKKITTYTQTPDKTPSQYTEEPMAKTLCFGDIHNKNDLDNI